MWPFRAVLREVSANLAAERWRAVLVSLLVLALTGTVVAVELRQAQATVDAQRALHDAGQLVFVATKPGEGGAIPAQRCIALASHKSVVVVGGLRKEGQLTLSKAPGERLVERPFVGDMPRVLARTDVAAETLFVVASPLADRVGVLHGGMLETRELGTGRVAVLDMADRVPDPGPWVWTPQAPAGWIDECWVEVVPSAAEPAADLLRAWFAVDESTTLVQPLLGEDRLRISPLDLFNQRATRLAWLIVGIVVGLIGALLVWFRRAEVALYRACGASRIQAAVIYVGHVAVPIAVGVISGVFSGLFVLVMTHAAGGPERLPEALRQGGMIFGVSMLVLGIAVCSIAAGRVVDQIRERL